MTATEILIIGGGIAGASTAYQLAQSAHDMTLLERGAIAGEASGVNAGSSSQRFHLPDGLANRLKLGLQDGTLGEHALAACADVGSIALEFLETDDFARIRLCPALLLTVALRQRGLDEHHFPLHLGALLVRMGLLARHFGRDEVWVL